MSQVQRGACEHRPIAEILKAGDLPMTWCAECGAYREWDWEWAKKYATSHGWGECEFKEFLIDWPALVKQGRKELQEEKPNRGVGELFFVSGDDRLLSEVVRDLNDHADEGITCPSCQQFVKTYDRQVYGGPAVALIRMYQDGGDEDGWLHLPSVDSYTRGGGDTAKCRFWELIEAMPGERKDGSKRTGWWRLTDKGTQFVLGEISIPRYAYTYNNVLRALWGEPWTIHDALGKKFNYNELMGIEVL